MPATAHRSRALRATAAADTTRRGDVRGRGRRRDRGQTLVEFALVLPWFLLLLFGMIEFGFLLNAQLSLNYATRDASLLAAEAGTSDGNADCVVLRKVDEDLSGPTDERRILRVHIFQADVRGVPTGFEQVYTRGGSTACVSGASVPYTLGAATFPYNARCAKLVGCVDSNGDSIPLDTIGVSIDYQYTYVTPTPYLFGGSGAGQTITGSNTMRMEPYTL